MYDELNRQTRAFDNAIEIAKLMIASAHTTVLPSKEEAERIAEFIETLAAKLEATEIELNKLYREETSKVSL
ncbi:MAG: hypothetical protein IJK52_13570 [Oscillospiraceae bacterium]|nr:hypothetical protein [Oscillospiraceae bacterium]